MKILSGIADVGFDDLYRRHERAQRKTRIILASAASIIIAALAGLSVFAFNQKSIAKAQESKARTALNQANYFAAMGQWNTNNVTDAHDFLWKIPSEHRQIEWHLANNQFQGSYITCYGHRKRVYSVSCSPDGKSIASGGWDSNVKIWDSVSGEERFSLAVKWRKQDVM